MCGSSQDRWIDVPSYGRGRPLTNEFLGATHEQN
jgi:hypothetical protein